MNGVMKTLKDSSAKIISQKFDTDCEIDITIRMAERDSLIAKLADVEGVTVSET